MGIRYLDIALYQSGSSLCLAGMNLGKGHTEIWHLQSFDRDLGPMPIDDAAIEHLGNVEPLVQKQLHHWSRNCSAS